MRAGERAELLLVEDLVDEPELAQGHDVPADVGRGDAGGLLPAVLQRVEREVGELGDLVLGIRGVDPEDTALVPGPVAIGEVGHRAVERSGGGGVRGARAGRSCRRHSQRVLRARRSAAPQLAVGRRRSRRRTA